MIQYFAFQPIGFGVSGLADSSVEKVILITDQDTPLLETPGSLRAISPIKRGEFSDGHLKNHPLEPNSRVVLEDH